MAIDITITIVHLNKGDYINAGMSILPGATGELVNRVSLMGKVATLKEAARRGVATNVLTNYTVNKGE